MSYTTATFSRLDRNGDGHTTIVLVYTGNAGEPSIEYNYPIDPAVMPSADYMRGLAIARLSLLNNNLAFVAGATSAIGTVLDTTTPLPPIVSPSFGSYRAVTAPYTPGAAPQDVFIITGSDTKSVRVTGMGLSTLQTTAGINSWYILKRSTANSGGTSALVTKVPTDPTYIAASAVVRQYTANPTAGTLVGGIWSGMVFSPGTSSVTTFTGASADFSRSPIILSGVGEILSWNFAAVTLPSGLSIQAWVTWEEFG